MSDIAEVCGISASAVSLGLRNHPSIPPATRAKIADIAQRLDYRPNPYVSALMSALRSGRESGGATLAVLTAWPANGNNWQTDERMREFRLGIADRAAALGFQVEDFCCGEGGLSSERLHRILSARGIRGIVLAPLPLDFPNPFQSFPWEHYSAAALGYSLPWPHPHRTTHDHMLNMLLALENLKAAGYRRPIFVTSRSMDRRLHYSWSATYRAFASEELQAPANMIPVLLDTDSKKVFRARVAELRPDVLIMEYQGHVQLASKYFPRLPVCQLNLLENDTASMGIQPQRRQVGAAAVDLVTALLNRNEAGLPGHAKTVLIEGRWQAAMTGLIKKP